jgi:outer membrane receptor protein involved in Fe transport
MIISSRILPTLLASACISSGAASFNASAQEQHSIDFDIPAQSMDGALRQIGKAGGIEILFDADDVRLLAAPAINGRMNVREALDAALKDAPLTIDTSGTSFLIRRARVTHAGPLVAVDASDRIVVTGSRIAGAARTSSVITVTAEDMRGAGQYQLGDVVRSIPQNFGGGQNPGVLLGSGRITDSNVNSATGVNLRGLGPDATLTLLNGKRLAYDAAVQSIDISAIPAAAVDRLEILTDGASAIYGSDAVAGVVNVILKKDYSGLEATANLGASTDGGDVQQQYSLVGGTHWAGGGVMLASDFGRNSAIRARNRSYTSTIDDSTTLLPSQRHYALVVSGHHMIAPSLTFDVDGLYSYRSARSGVALTAVQDFHHTGTSSRSEVRSFTISPRLSWKLSNAWTATLQGSYGQDNTSTFTDLNYSGVHLASYPARFDNQLIASEASAEGPLFPLPGGSAHLAIGAGYRANRFETQLSTVRDAGIEVNNSIKEKRSSIYLYGEVLLPLISAQNDVLAIHALSLTGALRYERYQRIGDIVTPKFGLVYAPIRDLTLRASWGKSFKAPTLRQQYEAQSALLVEPSYYGASGYPAGATVVEVTGGNPDLSPERARTWSMGLIFTPSQAPRLRLEASYFNIHYEDRVVVPIDRIAGALTNPLYADFRNLAPTRAEIESAIEGSATGLDNQSGLPFDPDDVSVLIDNRNRNATSQRFQGVDTSIAYRFSLGEENDISLSSSVTYLRSRQTLIAGDGAVPLAGKIFSPPHWRGRAGLVWALPELTLAAHFNYVGGVEDDRFAKVKRLDPMKNVDLNLRFEPEARLLKGFSIGLSIINLFNDKPSVIRTTHPSTAPFDSLNYSSIGRYAGVTIQRKW